LIDPFEALREGHGIPHDPGTRLLQMRPPTTFELTLMLVQATQRLAQTQPAACLRGDRPSDLYGLVKIERFRLRQALSVK